MRIEDMLRVIPSSIVPSVVSNEGVEGFCIAATAKLSASAMVGAAGRLQITAKCRVEVVKLVVFSLSHLN